jgi:hypothetical protein
MPNAPLIPRPQSLETTKPQSPPATAANRRRLGQQHCPNAACQILAAETSVRLMQNCFGPALFNPRLTRSFAETAARADSLHLPDFGREPFLACERQAEGGLP